MSTAAVLPSTPPTPRAVPLLGHLPAVWRDPLGLFSDGMRRHGDLARYSFGPYAFVLLNNPDHVRHVLVENGRNYRKSPDYKMLRLVLGDGLLTSEGDQWRRQRRLAQPAFHHRALATFAGAMAAATAGLLDRWQDLPGGAVLDVHDEMMRLTLRIVGRTLCSVEIDEEADAIGRALTEVIGFINERSTTLVPVPVWVPTRANRRFRKARATLDRLVYRIIEERRGSNEDHEDLLGLYMTATDEADGARMTDRQLRDELMTLVLAGHETTAVALSFTFDLLSRHPAVAQRLRDEAQSVLGDGPPTLAGLERLEYAGWVLQEAMRLYPPAWIIGRQALDEDAIGGQRIRRGTLIGICPYTLHRNPAQWQDPEAFDPERFSPERSRDRPRCAYLPFGAGQRICIGSAFALMEAKIILSMVARRHRVELVPAYRTDPEPSVTLRPRRGVQATIHPA